MHKVEYLVREKLEPYVSCIMYDACTNIHSSLKIPIYANGYPGIMFQQNENGFYFMPKGKLLSEFFLYGQTLDPMSLEVKGPYNYVVFHLYPFASKYLLDVDPKELNDDCFDLLNVRAFDIHEYHKQICSTESLTERIDLICDVMEALILYNKSRKNDGIQEAISLILKSDGQMKINEVLKKVFMSERTFERLFKAQVGLNPKQFARIVQFQKSMSILSSSNFEKLTEVGHDSGFSDQSHFIRTFKKYTGQTPSFYLKQKLA